MAKISILTLTYNGKHVISKCAQSIIEHCPEDNWEWIIRENGSTDGSLEYLQELSKKDPRIKVIAAKNDGNFSAMNNALVEYCTGEYVLFLNNDVEARSNFIKEMVSIIENDPEVGGVGAVLYYPDSTIQHCGIVFEPNCTAHNVSSYYMALRDLNKKLYEVDREYQGATGACFLMRVSDWKAVGLFDEEFNWCYDDVDLGLKIVYDLEKKIVVAAKAKLFHYESWSKANPNTWQAVSRLNVKWGKRLKDDVYYYSMDYNRYNK